MTIESRGEDAGADRGHDNETSDFARANARSDEIRPSIIVQRRKTDTRKS